MSYSLNKSESLRELSSIQEEAISGGKSSLVKSFPQVPNFSDLDFSFGRLFGLEINETSFYQKEETSDKISKSGKDGELSRSNSNIEEVDANSLTIS